MARKVGHAIHDILEAIGRIEELTRGKSLEDFETSWQMRWLVQRTIEIIPRRAGPFLTISPTPARRFQGEKFAASATSCDMTMRAYQTGLSGTSS